MGTHYRGSKEEMRALDAYIKLMRAAESVAGSRGPMLAEEGLTLTQFGVLEALYHLGPLPHCELGRKLLKSGGNITVVVDNLEKRGLVSRKRHDEDRRLVTVHLTSAGRRLIAGVFPLHVEAIVQDMGALTASEQETLSRLCRRVGTSAQREGR